MPGAPLWRARPGAGRSRNRLPWTAREIAKMLGMFPSEVHAYLHSLRRRGVADHEEGVWFLTDYGRRYYERLRDHIDLLVRGSGCRINKNKQESTALNVIPELEYRIKEWAGEVFEDCRDVVRLFL